MLDLNSGKRLCTWTTKQFISTSSGPFYTENTEKLSNSIQFIFEM